MCNLYSITTNQATIIALFRVINRYVGNLPPMLGVFPDYRHRDGDDALGHAPTPAHGRAAGHRHPQHLLAALAHGAQAREPLLKKPVAKGCARSLWRMDDDKICARLLRLGNRTHCASRYADPEEAGAMIDKPKLIMGEKAFSPSRFLVRQGGKGWMVYDRQRKGPAMLGTSLAANLMKEQADDIKLLLMAQLDDNHST